MLGIWVVYFVSGHDSYFNATLTDAASRIQVRSDGNLKLKTILLSAILTALPSYAGTITGNMIVPNGLPVRNGVLTFVLQQAGLAIGSGSVVPIAAQCATSQDGGVVGLPNQQTLPNVVPGGFSNLISGIYYAQTTFYNTSGESLPSPEFKIQTTFNQTLIVTPPKSFPLGATGMKVYIGAASGAETLQGTTANSTAQYIQSQNLAAGAAPPTVNSSICTIAFNDTIIPYSGYNVSLLSAQGNAYPGWPQAWQLNGGLTGTINVSQGSPLWNGITIYPAALLQQPLNHGPQSLGGNLSMSGYDLTNIGNLSAALSFNGIYFPPTIPSAISAAGQTGAVMIQPAYSGTEAWTNPNNVRVQDLRPRNPSNAPSWTTANGPMPDTTIKAADYGVKCDGTTDDYAAAQAVVDAPLRIIAPFQAGSQAMIPGVVKFPHGRCRMSQPLMLMNYGSIEGDASGTWFSPADNWSAPAGSAMINIVQSYSFSPSTAAAESLTHVERFVKDIAFEYTGSAFQVEAIKVYNQTGTTSSFPYPSGPSTNPQPYQIPFVSLIGNYVYAMDTAYDLRDCGNCYLENNNAVAVRNGLVNSGNNFSVQVIGGNLLLGQHTYTPVSSGNTSGVLSQSEVRWECTGGSGSACAGGTVAQDLITSPQTFNISNVTVESFDFGGNFQNALDLSLNNNDFDSEDIHAAYFGALKWMQIYHNEFALSSASSDVIQFAPLTNAQLTGIDNGDGTWFEGNKVFSYFPGNTGFGLNFLPGGGSSTNSRRNVYVTNNQFANEAIGVNMQSPLAYSLLTGNYGSGISNELFFFPVATTGSYHDTVLRDNMMADAEPIYVHAGTTGLIVGYNSAGNSSIGGQLTGSQTATGAGCTTAASSLASCMATVTIPQAYLDTNYTVNGCTISGQTNPAFTGYAVKTNGAQFNVTVYAATASAVSAGSVTCNVYEQ